MLLDMEKFTEMTQEFLGHFIFIPCCQASGILHFIEHGIVIVQFIELAKNGKR